MAFADDGRRRHGVYRAGMRLLILHRLTEGIVRERDLVDHVSFADVRIVERRQRGRHPADLVFCGETPDGGVAHRTDRRDPVMD